ncbi:MAG: hypothetical protein Q9162_004425 [Coniocarpon cinnabarinum]
MRKGQVLTRKDEQELETWVSALSHYDRNEFEESIRTFQPIADTSKILFNCGVIRATLGEHEEAVKYYGKAISLDQYLAIAYFQAGVSNFLSGDFEEALANFNDTLLYLRGNKFIDYEQLGLKYKLYSCEALFNRGLCYVYLQAVDTGIQDMTHASQEKIVDDHSVIDEAIKDRAEGYTVFSIPVGTVFRPSAAKVKNVRARDYLGKTQVRLVASANSSDPSGPSHRRNVSAETWSKSDRAPNELSYAATNLIRPNLISRSRQQSEPPMQRNLFPPTPPPEPEKPAIPPRPTDYNPQRRHPAKLDTSNISTISPTSAAQTRSAPVSDLAARPPRSHSANRAPKPGKLELGAAAFDRKQVHEPQRRAPARSASERPAERRREDEFERDRARYDARKERLFGAVEANEGADETSQRLVRERERSRNRRSDGRRHEGRRREDDIVEEDESEVVDDDPGLRGSLGSYNSGRSAATAFSSMSAAGLKSLRLKVHYPSETRYIVMPSSVSFKDFTDQITKKYGGDVGGKPLKIKTKDEEGDIITVGDQEDLDPCLSSARSQARKEGSEVGKLEVRAIFKLEFVDTDQLFRYGSRYNTLQQECEEAPITGLAAGLHAPIVDFTAAKHLEHCQYD